MKKIVLVVSMILLCFALCACQKDNTNNPNNSNNSNKQSSQNNNQSNGQGEQGVMIPEEDPEVKAERDEKRVNETLKLLNNNPNSRKEGSTYIKKIDDNHYGVYYFEGKDIAGYEYYVKFGNKDEAEEAKAAYDDPNRTVESIRIIDNMMVVIYSHVEYEGITVESIEDLIKE